MKNIIKLGMISIIVLLAACGGKEIEPTMDSEIAGFSATTQEGKTLTNEDLLDQWWVADFIFTNCTSICPPMTRNMTILQKRMQESGIEDVQFVSFSVDPEYDTPEVLTEYAKDHGADTDNWSFLTGYDFETIQEISIKSFQSALEPPPEGDDQVQHGTRFFLVNPEGKVVKSYIGTEADQMDEILADLEKVAK